jgi:hypothetical protein
MSGSNIDEDRNTTLRSKVTALQGKVASDQQTTLDINHGVRVAQDEIRARKGTP